MPIEILRLLSFEGPNIISPNPGVLLDASAEGDVRAGLRNALKDAGQQVGIVIGQLSVDAVPLHVGYAIRLRFATPTPALGAAIVRYTIAGLNAFAAGDSEWDGEEHLWALQQRRRAEALPFGAIQLMAEAQRRGIPAFRQADGRVQVGYGMRGTAFELAGFADALPIDLVRDIPWSQLGRIPILALSGIGIDLDAAVTDFTHAVQPIRVQRQADFAAARAFLCQPDLEAAAIELATESLLTHGLPFASCDQSVIGSVPAAPAPALDLAELARAIALPLLVTMPTGHATIAADPLLRELAAYAGCHVSFVSSTR